MTASVLSFTFAGTWRPKLRVIPLCRGREARLRRRGRFLFDGSEAVAFDSALRFIFDGSAPQQREGFELLS